MPVNDFKAFATGELANVLSQPEYEDLEALGTGFQSGIARSEELNKVWRQGLDYRFRGGLVYGDEVR
ncbi:hypothetical protein [Dryocola sp. BD586]|uniref:hypothetical protein n=1 Tax=Dryocola sp. BD586 TaxID=3133271 RepID=UPI003F4FCB38